MKNENKQLALLQRVIDRLLGENLDLREQLVVAKERVHKLELLLTKYGAWGPDD